jgi:asparagine synthase (glutamine-hydrolysing)
MCGIAGVIGKKELSRENIEEYLSAFKSCLLHRGPDDAGEHIGDNFGFAHTRLSIVDISGGRQPIYNEDKSIGIIYNGEVYNYLPLREDLKKRGCRFYTNSDTEVILRGYEEYGREFFRELNGMFSFCIWDDKEDTIYLVRDSFGIKPLYIYEDASRILFASELKAIIALPDIDLSLNPAGFQDYLTFRYVQAPDTFFKNIRKLEAGTYLEIKHGNPTQYRYWDVSYSTPFPYPDLWEVKEHLLATMHTAVKSQLMGEVPIGVLLSGGVDSSAIAYLIHACGANLTTFNIGFPEVNEFEYSREVAKKYGLRHIEIVTTTEELIKNFSKINFALDEPIADPACLPLYQLCEELKKHVTVVLSGEGGDEVFGGYPQYEYLWRSNIPYNSRFTAFMERSWYFSDALAFMRDKRLPPHQLRHRKYFEEQPFLNGMLAYDMKTWMPENLMMKADKIMMAHSLEGRFPFLDKELFDYAACLPQAYKISLQGVTKWLLKEAISPFLPGTIIARPKMGFTVPVDRLLQALKSEVMEVSDALPQSPLSEVLNTELISRCFHEYYAGKGLSSLQVWTLFTIAYWFMYSFPRYKSEKNVLPGRAQYLKEAFPNNTPQQEMG